MTAKTLIDAVVWNLHRIPDGVASRNTIAMEELLDGTQSAVERATSEGHVAAEG